MYPVLRRYACFLAKAGRLGPLGQRRSTRLLGQTLVQWVQKGAKHPAPQFQGITSNEKNEPANRSNVDAFRTSDAPVLSTAKTKHAQLFRFKEKTRVSSPLVTRPLLSRYKNSDIWCAKIMMPDPSPLDQETEKKPANCPLCHWHRLRGSAIWSLRKAKVEATDD